MTRVLHQVVRRGGCDGMIHHSDQGVQYTSHQFQQACRDNKIQQSMGSVGDCYDNAIAESFFAALKCEWLRGQVFESLHELRLQLRSYIDEFYNAKRLHSALGYKSPNEYEAEFRKFPFPGASPRKRNSRDLVVTNV